MTRETYIAVVGPSAGTPAELAIGEAVGRGIAQAAASSCAAAWAA
jgi:hypothetical protein